MFSLVVANDPSSGACHQCDRPTLYCICKNAIESKPDVGYISSSSSDGSVTPPVYQLKPSPVRSSAGLNESMINPALRHLTIPIHDPSDDIDSDTPIYKSHEENTISDKTAVLGEFTNTSSEDLMNQIYSGFIDKKDGSSSCTSSPLLREADHQLAELSKDV